MNLSMYEWVIIFTNIFWTYTIYKFMEVFFDKKKTHRIVEFLSYTLYYLVLTIICLISLLPIALMVFSFLAFLALSFNYESTIKNRILSVFFIYLISVGLEIFVGLLSGQFDFSLFSKSTYSSIFGLITYRIIAYAVVLVLNNFKNIKKGESVPNTYWFSIATIPTTSIYIIMLLFVARGIHIAQVMAGVALILLINFATFYLYDVITAALSDKMRNLLILEQNKYYDKQLDMIKSSLQTTNAIRHDLKNHMFSLRTLIENNDMNGSLNYISGIMADIGTRKDYSASGNNVIDSMINFKFQEAEQRGINTNLDLRIPENLSIPSFDMTIILGNLLDNAVKAASKADQNPFINFKMRYDKGRLIIQLANSFDGKIFEENGNLLTTNTDKEDHGYGILNIKNVIQKYDGTMDIEYKGNVFSVSLFMYVN